MRKTQDQDRRPSERTYNAGREVYAAIERNGRQSTQTNTLTRGRSLTALPTDQAVDLELQRADPPRELPLEASTWMTRTLSTDAMV
jgi:hypothetical protein